jgi:hypothetical protein
VNAAAMPERRGSNHKLFIVKQLRFWNNAGGKIERKKKRRLVDGAPYQFDCATCFTAYSPKVTETPGEL